MRTLNFTPVELPGFGRYLFTPDGKAYNKATESFITLNGGAVRVTNDKGQRKSFRPETIKQMVAEELEKRKAPKVEKPKAKSRERLGIRPGHKKTNGTADPAHLESLRKQHAKILQLEGFKHVKTWKLHNAGLSNKEVAQLVGTNVGRVYNDLRMYKEKPEMIEAANNL